MARRIAALIMLMDAFHDFDFVLLLTSTWKVLGPLIRGLEECPR